MGFIVDFVCDECGVRACKPVDPKHITSCAGSMVTMQSAVTVPAGWGGTLPGLNVMTYCPKCLKKFKDAPTATNLFRKVQEFERANELLRDENKRLKAERDRARCDAVADDVLGRVPL